MRAKPTFCTRTCKNCGAEYAPLTGNQKYCNACANDPEFKRTKSRAQKQKVENLKDILRDRGKIFRANRTKMGFVQRTYWVHADDADALRLFAEMLRSNRMCEQSD